MVGVGLGGVVNVYMNSSGNIYVFNDVNVGYQVNVQYVWVLGNFNFNYIYFNGNIDVDGRLNVGEFLYINGKVNVGVNCLLNGLQGMDLMGLLLLCVGGKWIKVFGGGGGFYFINIKDGNSVICLILNIDINVCFCLLGKILVVIMSLILISVIICLDNGQGVIIKSI